MINLEKIKQEKCFPPPTHTYTHTFKRNCLCILLPPPFFEVGRGVPTMLYTIFITKINLKLDLLNLNIFGSSEYEKMAIF